MLINLLRIFLGIFLGFLIPYFVFQKYNTIVKGPDSSDIQTKIFSTRDFCYRMIPYPILSQGKHI